MADNDLDPAASTQMFRAFVEREEPAPVRTRASSPRGSNSAAKLIGVVAVIAVIAVIVLIAAH